LSIFFKCMRCVVPGHFSGTLSEKKKQNIFFLVIFSCNLYISLIITTYFCKVPYSKNLESQENLKIKRSTTSIKMQGDLYPREVVISVLMDSSINKEEEREILRRHRRDKQQDRRNERPSRALQRQGWD
jgi:hypothetical protein